MSIANCEIVSIHAYEKSCQIVFKDGWKERLADTKLDALIHECQDKMEKQKVGKGIGKA